MKQIRRHLTYANVMSSIAVFLMLGGATAFAATKIGANELKANSIKTGKIVKEAVTAGKLKKGAVTESRIANGAVTNAKIADNAGTTSKIADNAVTTGKIANDAVTGDKVKESSLGQVPSAANANNANTVNHQSVVPFFTQVASNGAEATVINVGGVKLTATCNATKPVLVATKESGESAASRFSNVEETAEAFGNGQGSFSTLTLGNGKLLGAGTLEVVFQNGAVTTVFYAFRNDAFGGAGCRFFGRVIAS